MWLYFPTLLGDGGAHPRVETARRQVIYSAHPDAMIYATLDGSQPGPEVGGVFDRRRLVVRVPDATMTVRAVCVANGRCPPPPLPPCAARAARALAHELRCEGGSLRVRRLRCRMHGSVRARRLFFLAEEWRENLESVTVS